MAKNMVVKQPPKMTAGAAGGQGRLEKTADAAKTKVKKL